MPGFLLPMIAAAALVAAAAQPVALDVRPIDRAGYARMLAGMKGRPVVVNMWATWCEPCREEFPDLVRFHRETGPRGVEVVAVSLDMLSALKTEVIPFLNSQVPSFHLYIKTAGDDDEFINSVDAKWSGGLPATFVYDRQGRLVESLYESTSFDQLRTIVAPLLK